MLARSQTPFAPSCVWERQVGLRSPGKTGCWETDPRKKGNERLLSIYHNKQLSQLFRNDSLICCWSSSSPTLSCLTFNSWLWPLSSSEQDHCLDGTFLPPFSEPLFTIANTKTQKAWQLNQKDYMGRELQTCWEKPMYIQLEVSGISTNTFDPVKNAQKCLNSAYPKNSPNSEIVRIFVRKNTPFVWKNTSFVRVTLSVRVKYAFYTYKARIYWFCCLGDKMHQKKHHWGQDDLGIAKTHGLWNKMQFPVKVAFFFVRMMCWNIHVKPIWHQHLNWLKRAFDKTNAPKTIVVFNSFIFLIILFFQCHLHHRLKLWYHILALSKSIGDVKSTLVETLGSAIAKTASL